MKLLKLQGQASSKEILDTYRWHEHQVCLCSTMSADNDIWCDESANLLCERQAFKVHKPAQQNLTVIHVGKVAYIHYLSLWERPSLTVPVCTCLASVLNAWRHGWMNGRADGWMDERVCTPYLQKLHIKFPQMSRMTALMITKVYGYPQYASCGHAHLALNPGIALICFTMTSAFCMWRPAPLPLFTRVTFTSLPWLALCVSTSNHTEALARIRGNKTCSIWSCLQFFGASASHV